MKIGILTFNFAINYGAALQCYALQQELISQGLDARVIDFLPDNAYQPFWRGNQFRASVPQALMKSWIKWQHTSDIKREFRNFYDRRVQLTSQCGIKDLPHVANQFDAIIVGSDQVWVNGFHDCKAFFLGWIPAFSGVRISYAPCCGRNVISNRNRQGIAALIKQLDHVSVRNQETFAFVKELTGRTPQIVADPTMLHHFRELVDSVRTPQTPYILAYVLVSEIEGGHEEAIAAIKRNHGNLPVVAIVLSENRPQYFKWADRILYSAAVEEWVNLIAGCQFLYTDSFHATIFALKFRKHFLAYYPKDDSTSRHADMAKRYHIDRHIVTSLNQAIERDAISSAPDYERINPEIEAHVLQSKRFLQASLT